ncbi:MAG: hypothetical protein KAS94_12460, partial [Desulfobulbaceae bacterium]|nr:hypothetical protein [Desulfobulbaceae bacterium]
VRIYFSKSPYLIKDKGFFVARSSSGVGPRESGLVIFTGILVRFFGFLRGLFFLWSHGRFLFARLNAFMFFAHLSHSL